MTASARPDVTIVIPTIGRPSLPALLAELVAQDVTDRVIVVDDRPGRESAEPLELGPAAGLELVVRPSGGCGPATARNVGWRAARTGWVEFLDDDVLPEAGWWQALGTDLDVPPEVAGIQGRVVVPLPPGRRPDDRERGTAGLAGARWITADMAYRHDALVAVGGFDERFRRAFREDSDLALRVQAAGGGLGLGRRVVRHPVRPGRFLDSVTAQRGNRDDMLMRRLHGRDWHAAAGAPQGRRNRHVAATAAAGAAVAAAVTRQRVVGALAGAAWAGLTARFAWERIAPGPRDRAEVARMLITSAAIPPVATWHSVAGWLTTRHATAWTGSLPPDAGPRGAAANGWPSPPRLPL